MTFWDHLDVLRNGIIRIMVAFVGVTVVLFAFKDFVFAFFVKLSQVNITQLDNEVRTLLYAVNSATCQNIDCVH